ncbi:substrate-binding periplasmic protein [Thalassotalea fusca]
MRIILLILSMLAFAGNTHASTEINYFVIQDQAQPFQNHINKQEHDGIVTDIVKRIFSGPEYKLKIHTLPFNRMIKMLEDNRYKNWITFGSPNWPGVQSLNLSDMPIFQVKHALLTSKQQESPINKIEDMFGKTVVLLHGFNYPGLEEYIADKKINAINVKNYQAAFKVVDRLADKAGFVEMDVRIKYNLDKEALDVDDYVLHNFSNIIADYNLHLAMSDTFDKKAQQHVNDTLKTIQRDGTLASIVAAY